MADEKLPGMIEKYVAPQLATLKETLTAEISRVSDENAKLKTKLKEHVASAKAIKQVLKVFGVGGALMIVFLSWAGLKSGQLAEDVLTIQSDVQKVNEDLATGVKEAKGDLGRERAKLIEELGITAKNITADCIQATTEAKEALATELTSRITSFKTEADNHAKKVIDRLNASETILAIQKRVGEFETQVTSGVVAHAKLADISEDSRALGGLSLEDLRNELRTIIYDKIASLDIKNIVDRVHTLEVNAAGNLSTVTSLLEFRRKYFLEGDNTLVIQTRLLPMQGIVHPAHGLKIYGNGGGIIVLATSGQDGHITHYLDDGGFERQEFRGTMRIRNP